MKKLFGTFGVRRVVNEVLTPEFAAKLAAAYGNVYQGTIAVGGDTRTSTPMIKHAVIAGLLSSGCDVMDLGILPTPAVQYAVRNYYDGGVIITASHNPPNYNGIKFVDELGIGIPNESDLKIEDLFFNDKIKRVNWNELGQVYKNDRIIEEYQSEVLKRLDVEAIKNKKLKVVLDPGSGAACFTAPYILRKLGCEVLTLNSQVDGFFPGREPEPIPENLTELISTVKSTGADIGLAHDGDADRTIAIDEKGDFVLGDKTFALVEGHMLKENNGGLVVTTVATSQAIYDVAEENNGEVIATAVGDLLVARKLHEADGLFGGEENGGLIFPDFVYGRDAALSAAKILEIMAKENKPLSELVKELPVYYSEKIKIECPDDKKSEVMANVSEEIKNNYKDLKTDLTDGVKVISNDGWLIIRPSGTEPIFRCFAEAQNQEKASEMANWGISLIKQFL